MEIYKDKSYPVEERVKNLLSLMTVEEKLAQMHIRQDYKDIEKSIRKGKMDFGGIYGSPRISVKKQLSRMRAFQKYAVEKTRLGIPLLFYGEGIHGFNQDTTVFPQCIGMASSFNPALIEEVAAEIGKEAASFGVNQLFAPNLDLAREPRWGRVQETYGEDPYLVSEMTSAYVKGLQSQNVAATVKHYLAHGSPENGLNLSTVHMGEREIRELSLPAFEKCIRSGAMALMPAYHDLDGVPMHANKKWMVEVLRKELNFGGVTVSDWGGVSFLKNLCGAAKDGLEAGKLAIAAEVDIEAPDAVGYGEEFKAAVERGEVSEKALDRAVERILTLKFRLGLFDRDWKCGTKGLNTARSLRLAKKAAEQSVVLLKNDGALPFKNTMKIAVVGPAAKNVQLGGYCRYPEDLSRLVSVYDGISAVAGKENVFYGAGCGYFKGTDEQLCDALEACEKADAVVVACGDKGNFYGGVGWGDEEQTDTTVSCGEGFDVHDLRLPECQRKLVSAVKATGKKVILILATGRPSVIIDEYEKADAVLQTWYLGFKGGEVIGEILFGKTNPTGKLAVSFPRSNGHLPCYYNYGINCKGALYRSYGSEEKPGRSYVFDKPDAFLPFGFGLGYVPVEYKSVKTVKEGENTVRVTVTLKNAGDRDTEESVLVFLRSKSREGVVPYVKELKAFTRTKIKAGKEKRVNLYLDEESFTYIGADLKKKVGKGDYTVFVNGLSADFTL